MKQYHARALVIEMALVPALVAVVGILQLQAVVILKEKPKLKPIPKQMVLPVV